MIAFGLEIWKLTVVLPPNGMLDDPKVFKIDGGEATCKVSEKLLHPAVGSQTMPVLTLSPEVDGVTVTVKTQEPPDGNEAPEIETPVGVTTIAALLLPHVAGLADPGVPARFAGKLSVNVTLNGGLTGVVVGFGF